MPGIARNDATDVAGGPIIQGSPNVYVNGKHVARINDRVQGHGSGAHAAPVMAGGSSNVKANNIGVSRQGDPATCGHPASGSPNVFANG